MLYLKSSRENVRRQETMTTEDKNDVKYVVKILLIISLLVVSSSIVEFNIIDVIYLSFIAVCFINYLRKKIKASN